MIEDLRAWLLFEFLQDNTIDTPEEAAAVLQDGNYLACTKPNEVHRRLQEQYKEFDEMYHPVDWEGDDE